MDAAWGESRMIVFSFLDLLWLCVTVHNVKYMADCCVCWCMYMGDCGRSRLAVDSKNQYSTSRSSWLFEWVMGKFSAGCSTWGICEDRHLLWCHHLLCSPQAVEGKGVNLKSDVYSFGIVLWELLTGEIPYNGKMLFETLMLIVDGKVDINLQQPCT